MEDVGGIVGECSWTVAPFCWGQMLLYFEIPYKLIGHLSWP